MVRTAKTAHLAARVAVALVGRSALEVSPAQEDFPALQDTLVPKVHLAPRELVVSKVPKVTLERLALLVSPAKLAPSVLPAPRVLVALSDLAVSQVHTRSCPPPPPPSPFQC